MGILQENSELESYLNQTIEILSTIQNSINLLFELATPIYSKNEYGDDEYGDDQEEENNFYELSFQIKNILNNCNEAQQLLDKSIDQCELLNILIGSNIGLLVSIGTNIALNSSNDQTSKQPQNISDLADFESYFINNLENLKETLNESLQFSGEILKKGVIKGKKLAAGLQLLVAMFSINMINKSSSLLTFLLEEDIIASAIEVNNKIIAAPGLPLSENSIFADIKKMSEKNEENLGINSDLVEAYEILEEDRKKKIEKSKKIL
jgi:hypothetical protein